MLFNSLPRRCVVLLEDIDSAGVNRRDDEDSSTTITTTTTKGGKRGRGSEDKELVKDLTKAIKAANKDKNKDAQGISLSGLLNAIDGVASHEGRVLIMTTNFPEKLDDALIRPGRVDMKIEFRLASREQIRELFIRMYSSDTFGPAKILANGHIAPGDDITKESAAPKSSIAITSKGSTHKSKSVKSTPRCEQTSAERLLANFSTHSLSHPDILHLAAEFANKLPEGTFSPAEIQGFLLMRKKDPQKAVDEVDRWREKTIVAKEVKRIVVKGGNGEGEGDGNGGGNESEGLVEVKQEDGEEARGRDGGHNR
jgi:chaperone BCS1